MRARLWPARLALFLVLTVLLSAGCSGGAGSDAKLTRVRFTEVIHSIFYGPQYVAQAKGFFEAEGIRLEMSTAQGSDKGTAALLAGTADIALVGPETTVFVYNQDTPNKVRMFAQMTATDGSFLVARQPDAQFAWSHVQSRSIIGWRPGSMPQMIAASVLKRNGLTNVEYISNLAAPAMAGAFTSGQGDYLQVFEPTASQLEKAGLGHVVVSVGEAYGVLPYTGYTATTKFIGANPDLIQRYTNAVYRATLYLMQTDPAIVAKEVAPYFEGTEVALLESSIRRYKEIGAWKPTPVMAAADFDRLQDLMIEGGVLEPGKRAPFDKITTNTFAEQAVKSIRKP